jgi:hypothetical protein
MLLQILIGSSSSVFYAALKVQYLMVSLSLEVSFFFFSLHGFIDADWVGSIDDRKSTGIYLVFFGQTPIS